mmetsp:Transcript_22507/g.34012  ORF Transcript_22507/g.34012 Transcript_22507/m.34012 type:complete len:297 (+) Transcript_22507:149-1039(+)
MMKLAIVLGFLIWLNACMARFSVSGPVFTLTFKDAEGNSGDNTKLLDISNLRPVGHLSFQSSDPTLPKWAHALKSIRGKILYNHAECATAPSAIEGDFRFTKDGLGDLQIQPGYNIRKKTTSCVLQATKGNSINIVARLSLGRKHLLDSIKGNFMFNLPDTLSLSEVKVSPGINFLRNTPSLTFEGITRSRRTKAVLNLQNDDSTVTVVHALDERNIISPQIMLKNAKIVYNWNVMLDSGSVRTRVDPTEAIDITWTDRSMNGGWVTDISVPLKMSKVTSLKAMASNIRVRRQFSF